MTACRYDPTGGPRWSEVPGYEGLYDVNEIGQVWSHKSERLMKGSVHNGYPVVYLWRNGRGDYRKIHRIVLAAFVGPCPPGHEVRHLDGIRAHSTLDNLAYGTRSENQKDSVAHGTHNFLRHPTACGNGHEWTEESTRYYTKRNGRTVRDCRICHADRERSYRARNRKVGA